MVSFDLLPDSTSVAHLTFGTRSRLVSQPNVRSKSYTRVMDLLVFLMVPTFALDRAAEGSKCRNRNTRLRRRANPCGARPTADA